MPHKRVGGRTFAPTSIGEAYSIPPDLLTGFEGDRFATGKGKGGDGREGKG